jgi:hypothetical protein
MCEKACYAKYTNIFVKCLIIVNLIVSSDMVIKYCSNMGVKGTYSYLLLMIKRTLIPSIIAYIAFIMEKYGLNISKA